MHAGVGTSTTCARNTICCTPAGERIALQTSIVVEFTAFCTGATPHAFRNKTSVDNAKIANHNYPS